MVHLGRRALAATAGPPILAGVAGVVFLLVAPSPGDLAAHTFRAELFRREGFSLWNGLWYGGHHVPGYSVLFPPVAAALGPRLAGTLSSVSCAVLLAALVRGRWGAEAWIGSLWAGLAAVALLGTAQFAFAFGLAFGLASLVALQRGPRAPALALGLLCPLGSPVAGLFLAIAAAALVVAGIRRAAGLALAAVAALPVIALTAAFPEGGTKGFGAAPFLEVLACAALVVVVGRGERTLRAGAVVYAAAVVLFFVLPSPVGDNVTRLAVLVTGPICAAVLRARPVLLALLAAPLLVLELSGPVGDLAPTAGDPSVHESFYTDLLAYVQSRGGPPARLEIPFTRNHWETAWVAPHVALARGWERQVDRRDNALFYRPFSAADYRAWLDALAVRWVALPQGVPLDPAALREAALLRAGLPFLRPVWRDARWTVWELRRPAPVAAGPARLESLGADELRLRARRAGIVTLQVRFTPYWALAEGRGCVRPAPEGWTELRVRAPGPVRLVTSFAPGRVRATEPRCR